MTLGQKLKKLRMDKDLTQKDLADQLHVSFQTVSKWENDENEPDISTLKELAKLYSCSVDYLINEDEPIEEEDVEEEEQPLVEEQPRVTIIHQRELHVCERCKKDIPENDLDTDQIMTRPGGRGRSPEYRTAYYHKECLRKIMSEKAEALRREKAYKAARTKKLSFGWGIAGGVVALIVTLLVLLLVPACKEAINPGVAVAISIGVSYGIFSMLYCIISGSYIGEVFVWCATLSIRFPGLIFSWSIEGFAWLIAMKILFAILGFLIGVLALLFAIVLSSALGAVSFPFVLIHNIHTNYEDSF